MHYESDDCYSDEYLQEINKKVNALRYVNAEKNGTLEKFKMVNIEDFDEVYSNDDWYLIVSEDLVKEKFIDSDDERIKLEMSDTLYKIPVKTKKYPSRFNA